VYWSYLSNDSIELGSCTRTGVNARVRLTAAEERCEKKPLPTISHPAASDIKQYNLVLKAEM